MIRQNIVIVVSQFETLRANSNTPFGSAQECVGIGALVSLEFAMFVWVLSRVCSSWAPQGFLTQHQRSSRDRDLMSLPR